MNFTKPFPYRPHDYVYDPLFSVSGPVDHYKAGVIAKMSTIKFQICPIFDNMFSDLPNHPRYQLVQRRSKPIKRYEDVRKSDNNQHYDPMLHKKIDVVGSDRQKYFCHIINLPTKDMLPSVGMKYPKFTIEPHESEPENSSTRSRQSNGRRDDNKRDVVVETQFRESDAQTIPWEPPYIVIGKGDPELLKLDFLKWASGLPAGMHEVRLIERARMKRAWQNAIKPDINDSESLQKFAEYIEALERDEWTFREQEIQEIHDMRLFLLEQMLLEVQEASVTRAEAKIRQFAEAKMKEKEEKLAKVKHKAARELRKLELAGKGLNRRYHCVDVVEENISKKSELYAPLLRNGEHPKRWHMVIDEHLKRYRAQFIGVEDINTLPKWLNQATNLRDFNKRSKNYGTELCIRETKWTAPVLKELYEELLNLRRVSIDKRCNLRVRLEEPEEDLPTPEVEGIPEIEEAQYEAIVILQSLLKGRATQMMIYEGRDNCKELINELRNSVGLLKKEKEEKAKDKLKVRLQQREETIQSIMVNRLQGTLGKLQGAVVGSLIDFLNKELRRLLEERKAHAICWVNERERKIREAAEAGRRQKEVRRRREHDEMFKQVVKFTQDSLDLYLRDIITEGIEFASEIEAKDYVLDLAKHIEEDAEKEEATYKSAGVDAKDEMVADMLHHFLLPEVEKQLVRDRIHVKQKQTLKTVHDAIYSECEHLPKIERFPSRESSSESEPPEAEESLESVATEQDSATLFVTGILQHIRDSVVNKTEDYHPDVLEIYLNELAFEADHGNDEGLDRPREIREREGFSTNILMRTELDTIIEVETEASTKEMSEQNSVDLDTDVDSSK